MIPFAPKRASEARCKQLQRRTPAVPTRGLNKLLAEMVSALALIQSRCTQHPNDVIWCTNLDGFEYILNGMARVDVVTVLYTPRKLVSAM